MHPDFVQGDGGIGGRIVKSDDQSIGFMGESYVERTNDNWKTSTKSDVCIFGHINRVTGKASVTATYGKCDPPNFNGPINSIYDLTCTVVKQLF